MDNIKIDKKQFGIKNRALLILKPSAFNDKVINYIEEKLQKEKLMITKKGKIDGKTIEGNRLIDVHYGSISKKAMK